MHCKNCGAVISGDDKFCKNCGEKLMNTEMNTETNTEIEENVKLEKTEKLTPNGIFNDKKKIGIIAVAIIVLLSGLYYYLDNGRRIENMMNEINIIDSRFDEYILSGEEKESYDLISKDIQNLSDNKN